MNQDFASALPSQLRSTFLRQARRTSPNPRELTGLVRQRQFVIFDVTGVNGAATA